MYLPSQLERTPQLTLYVMVDIYIKRVVGVHLPPSPAWINFCIMMECMECMPESACRCHSVYSVALAITFLTTERGGGLGQALSLKF